MSQTAAASSRVIVPRPLKWYDRLAASLAYILIEVVARTLRLRWDTDSAVDRISTGNQAIFCIWHNRLAMSQIVYRDYICPRTGRKPRLAAIVSASKDGGIVARILEHFKVQPVRGSSSRRGPQALLELTTWAEHGCDLAITPDGPRGPRYVVQPGVISLAQLTGLPIVAVSYHFNWKFALKSWDRFQIPLPFSRGLIKLGQPLDVPRDASDEQRESLRKQLEATLRGLAID